MVQAIQDYKLYGHASMCLEVDHFCLHENYLNFLVGLDSISILITVQNFDIFSNDNRIVNEF